MKFSFYITNNYIVANIDNVFMNIRALETLVSTNDVIIVTYRGTKTYGRGDLEIAKERGDATTVLVTGFQIQISAK